MVASALIMLFSAALLIYWLRYTCLLLLDGATGETDATFTPFSFHEIRRQLAAGGMIEGMHKSLDLDYRALTYLGAKTGALSGLEARLLVWDYRLMRCWYALARTAFPAQGRKVLAEMADVLAVLATKLRASTA